MRKSRFGRWDHQDSERSATLSRRLRTCAAATYYKWKAKLGVREVSEARKLKAPRIRTDGAEPHDYRERARGRAAVETGAETGIGGRIKRILPYIGDDEGFCLGKSALRAPRANVLCGEPSGFR
jgi:hypothetical protein